MSQIASSVTIYLEIARRRPDLEPLLHEPWYFDRYGEERPGDRPWFAAPIVSGLPDRFRFVYLRWYIDKAQSDPDLPRLNGAQVELLDVIDELAHDPAIHLDVWSSSPATSSGSPTGRSCTPARPTRTTTTRAGTVTYCVCG